MKKILFLLIFCLFFQPTGEARDYVKLHLKEMKHAEKYGATDQYFADYSAKNNISDNIELKDPKLIKLSGYDDKTISKYENKLKKDEIEYKKIKSFLHSRKVDDYNIQAYSEDFYKVYRVAEKLIRANKLDYVNWRIVIDANRNFNASSSNLNCLTFHTGLIDTFKGNDDALALIVAHELAHSMLGHTEKLSQIHQKMVRAKESNVSEAYLFYRQKFLINSKNAEFAADVEAAKLVIKANFNLDKAKEALSLLNTMDYTVGIYSTHPNGEKRLKNFEENRRYFMEEEWAKQGKYNIIKSDVLQCEKSSDRKSIVILRGDLRNNEDYYRPENATDIYKRVAYQAYLDKEMKTATKYFKKLIKENKNDAISYLYLSYIEEYKFKLTGKEKFIQRAKEYIGIAYLLEEKNKHIKEQKELLFNTL